MWGGLERNNLVLLKKKIHYDRGKLLGSVAKRIRVEIIN